MTERAAFIPSDQALSPQGCGAGTDTACYALTGLPSQFECGKVLGTSDGMQGVQLGWRVNEDAEGNVWCPKGILAGSKIAETFVEVTPPKGTASPQSQA